MILKDLWNPPDLFKPEIEKGFVSERALENILIKINSESEESNVS